jgi:mRNA interferase MazF
MAEVRRGEIWLFSFPKPDRRRPVLVLTRQEMIGRLHTVTVAPITSTLRDAPSEVVVGPEAGLKHPSAINLHHLATVPLRGLRRWVGTVTPEILDRVELAMRFALGFDRRR